MAESLCNLPIDKLARLWYNGISGPGERGPGGRILVICRISSFYTKNFEGHFCPSWLEN